MALHSGLSAGVARGHGALFPALPYLCLTQIPRQQHRDVCSAATACCCLSTEPADTQGCCCPDPSWARFVVPEGRGLVWGVLGGLVLL